MMGKWHDPDERPQYVAASQMLHELQVEGALTAPRERRGPARVSLPDAGVPRRAAPANAEDVVAGDGWASHRRSI